MQRGFDSTRQVPRSGLPKIAFDPDSETDSETETEGKHGALDRDVFQRRCDFVWKQDKEMRAGQPAVRWGAKRWCAIEGSNL
jgi:hypothetical protein